MAKFFTYILSIRGYYVKGRLKFNVTPKGKPKGNGAVAFSTYAPQLFLMVLAAASVVWAIAARSLGWLSYDIAGWGAEAFWLNFLWVTWTFALAGYVVQLSLRKRLDRVDTRFADRFPLIVNSWDHSKERLPRQMGISKNLNSTGMAFESPMEVPVGSRVEVSLPLSTDPITAAGTVLRVDASTGSAVPMFLHGVEFDNLPQEERDAVESHCIQHALPVLQIQHRSAITLMTRATEWIADSRREKRQRALLPARIKISSKEGAFTPWETFGVLDDISPRGARLMTTEPIAPGTYVEFSVPHTEFAGNGTAVIVQAQRSSAGVRFAVGVRKNARSF